MIIWVRHVCRPEPEYSLCKKTLLSSAQLGTVKQQEQSLSSTYLDNTALKGSPPSPLTFQKSPGTRFYGFYGAISQTRLCQCESKHSITLAHLQIPIYLCIPLRRCNTSQSEEVQYIKSRLVVPQRVAFSLAIIKTFQALFPFNLHLYNRQGVVAPPEKLWAFFCEVRMAV